MMKQISLKIVLVVAGILFGGLNTTLAGPNIEFDGGHSFDFGNVRPNTLLEHVFVFRNTGDQVLQIPRVKGG